ncbi:MAG: hypothetical protein ACJ8ER_06605 [Allosphingosinicella sp.]
MRLLAVAGFSGLAFLVPLLLIALVLEKGVAFAGRLADPVAKLFPERIIGIGAQTLLGVGLLILFSLAAGLLAHTRAGRSLFDSLGGTVVGALPQFVAARAITRILDPEEADIVVVLVPVGPRWSIGFAFGPLDGAWASIYLPNAPRCTSGSVSFVRTSDIHPLDIDVVTAVRLIRRLGQGAEHLLAGLTLPNAAAGP